MKKILIVLFCFLNLLSFSQINILHAGETDWPTSKEQSDELGYKTLKVMSCAANTIITTGYPAWTNYYAGFMFMVNNTSTCNIVVNCFEARFQGTSGYRIYTKIGTFIGFETLIGSWTLIGNVANGVTSVSTTTSSPIPISVNVSIPPGSSQSFYLTRTDNVVANRHLYVTGTGTAGTTIYASDANIQITEAEYLDTYFILQTGVRRPSFDIYYDKICGVLPIELLSFKVSSKDKYNLIEWSTASESNNNYFIIERSEDGLNWTEVIKTNGYNSQSTRYYESKDSTFKSTINYYRLTQFDYNGHSKTYKMVFVDNSKPIKKLVKITNILGQEIRDNTECIKLYFYDDGSVLKKF